MSRIYFHSPSNDVEVLGSERAHMGVTISNIALACMSLSWTPKERYGPLLPPGHYLLTMEDGPRWKDAFCTAMSVGMSDFSFNVDGRRLDPFDLTLNTIVAVGSDPLEFMARVHATCEIHGYVEGPHRDWLADIVQEGLETHLLRANAGWDAVITLLRAHGDEPVVMSYSVGDGFPNNNHLLLPWPEGVPADWNALSEEQKRERDEHQAAVEMRWYDEMTDDERWDSAMTALREGREGSVDLHPDMWGERGFGNGWSVLDLDNWLTHPDRQAPSGEAP